MNTCLNCEGTGETGPGENGEASQPCPNCGGTGEVEGAEEE